MQTLITETSDRMKHPPEFFSASDIASISAKPLPKHIAIIPDGNRRWAKSHLLPTLQGHVAGADNTVQIIRAAKELGIGAVTFYAFSTENWKRPTAEIQHLMKTIGEYLDRYCNKLVASGIRLHVIGAPDGLGDTLKEILDTTCHKTAGCTDFDLILAINYGGRDEICRAVKKLIAANINPTLISQEMISQFLDTKDFSDPDLIIRTSGEMRLSNFLLWQSSYSELYIDTTAWPDFTPNHLLQAVKVYQTRVRRIGGK